MERGQSVASHYDNIVVAREDRGRVRRMRALGLVDLDLVWRLGRCSDKPEIEGIPYAVVVQYSNPSYVHFYDGYLLLLMATGRCLRKTWCSGNGSNRPRVGTVGESRSGMGVVRGP